MKNAGLLKVLLAFVLCSPAATQTGKWFEFRLLRNAGLVTVTGNASSANDCLNSCVQTTGCSAVSYQQSSAVCLRSMCNVWDLFYTTGWNTYILNWQVAFVEGMSVLAPQFEWMLTDSCGSDNQGVSNGPKFNLYSVAYAPSQTASAGNAPSFAGNTSSYGMTDSDSRISSAMSNTSQSISLWIKWSSNAVSTLTEFSDESASRGIFFWLFGGGLQFDVRGGTDCVSLSLCRVTVNSFVPVINAWYHVAYVYNGVLGTYSVYLNSTLVYVSNTGIFRNSLKWSRITIGLSIFDKNGPLKGQLYCYKIHNAALNADQVAAIANSCLTGKARLSP